MNIRDLIYRIGCSMIHLKKIIDTFDHFLTVLYSGYVGAQFAKCGSHLYVKRNMLLLKGAKNMIIGDNVWIGKNVQLTAWSHSRIGQQFYPKIVLGNNCSIGDNSHITAIDRIILGNNVLLGKNVLISDNAHGASNLELLTTPPNYRPLSSKGPVIIEDNVWIGEKSSILPGVRIGFGAIVGAASVVTKNVPAYAVVAGNPARVVKVMNNTLSTNK